VLRAPVLAGRGFGPADLAPGARAVIVDQGFVDRMMQGRSPVGRQLRLSPRGEWTDDPAAPWYEVVGVVKDLGMGFVMHRHRTAGVYLPAAPGSAGAVYMVVHARGDRWGSPRTYARRGAVDPTLRVSELQRLDEITRGCSGSSARGSRSRSS
jgi:hypothetical protein